MKLEKELVAASSVPLVLSILSEGDSYGYAIIQRVKELSGGKIESLRVLSSDIASARSFVPQ